MPSVRTFLCEWDLGGLCQQPDLASRLGKMFGYGYEHPKRDPSMAAVHPIRALGLNLRDVRHIGMTHMDLDHIGGLSDSRTRKTALIPPAGPEASEI